MSDQDHSDPPPEEEAPAPGGLTEADIESNWEESIDAFDHGTP